MQALEPIQQLAQQLHGDQQRKYEPGPYFVHLDRVMKLVNEYTSDTVMLAAALLHDVIEDTNTTAEQLLGFLRPIMDEKQAKRTVQLVKELTDTYTKERYPQWNRRKRKAKETERLAATSAEAQTIKYADITDNSLSIMNAADDFVNVYLKEARTLLNAMTKGDALLRQRAIDTVDSCIRDAESARKR